jgi:S-adenosylmethionine:diacylglycerol 3-amino-3-carboxypropyl transferase
MKSDQKAQVELSDFLFGMSWEDPISDRRALQIQPGDTLFTITSGGCKIPARFLRWTSMVASRICWN